MTRYYRPRRPRIARRLRTKDSFSLLELVVVVAVLAMLTAIVIPFFQSLIKQAAYVAGKWTLASAKTSCAVNKTLPIPAGFGGTQFSSSKPSDVCSGVLTATHADGCQLSIDLENGVRTSTAGSGWPETYEVCELGIQIADNRGQPIEQEKSNELPVAESIGEDLAEPTENPVNASLNPVNASFQGWEGSYTEARIEDMHYLDVDGDGVSEIISIGRTGTFLHFNNGEEWVSKRIAQGIDRSQITLGDIDGDGDQDIMFAGYRGGGGIGYFENTGDIALDENDINLPTRYISSGLQRGPTDIEMADIDGDGTQDLIVTASEDNSVYIYRNGSPDNYNGPNPVPGWEPVKIKQEDTRVGMYRSQVADIDGDGDLEILAAGDDLWIFDQGENGDWVQTTEMPIGNHGFEVRDIDNDGDLDILGNFGSTIQWHENDGTGSIFKQKELAKLTTYEVWGSQYGSSNFAMDDIDQDGDLDIVSASRGGKSISWYENTGGDTKPSYTEGSILIEGDFSGARRVLMSDFDGDGDIDIAGGAYYGKGGNEDNRRLIIFDNQPTERTQ